MTLAYCRSKHLRRTSCQKAHGVRRVCESLDLVHVLLKILQNDLRLKGRCAIVQKFTPLVLLFGWVLPRVEQMSARSNRICVI